MKSKVYFWGVVFFLSCHVLEQSAIAQGCKPTPISPPLKVKIIEKWKNRHAEKGVVPGCWLLIQKEQKIQDYVFTAYESLCEKVGSEILVEEKKLCCEKDPEKADFLCQMKTFNPMARVGLLSGEVFPSSFTLSELEDFMSIIPQSGFRIYLYVQRLVDKIQQPQVALPLRKYRWSLNHHFSTTDSKDEKAALAFLFTKLKWSDFLMSQLATAMWQSQHPMLFGAQVEILKLLAQSPQTKNEWLPFAIQFKNTLQNPQLKAEVERELKSLTQP
jgi:hypothetical protein